MSNIITRDKANKVYDLLVSIGGASEDETFDFIYHHCESEFGCSEWRFRGKLGFGGKYRSTWNGVTYYPEDETPEMARIKAELDERLSEI
jgi:hypothetical protein